jgi:hypothetical protein
MYFYISNYSQNKQIKPALKIEPLTALLKQSSIKYQMVSNWTWQMEAAFATKKQPVFLTKKLFAKCEVTKCLQVLNSKLYICPKASSGIELGLVQVDDYIDLKSDNLRKELIEFYKKDYFEACEYCIMNEKRVVPAMQKREG